MLASIMREIREAYLFRSRKGTNQAISRVQAWTIMSDAANELGIENIGTHYLRKRSATIR